MMTLERRLERHSSRWGGCPAWIQRIAWATFSTQLVAEVHLSNLMSAVIFRPIIGALDVALKRCERARLGQELRESKRFERRRSAAERN